MQALDEAEDTFKAVKLHKVQAEKGYDPASPFGIESSVFDCILQFYNYIETFFSSSLCVFNF